MQGTEVSRGRSVAPVTLPFYSSASTFGFTGFSDFDSDASHYLGARDRLILSPSHHDDNDVAEEVPNALRDFVGAAVGRVRSKAGLSYDNSTAREAAEAVLRSPNPTERTMQERLLELHHAAAKDNDEAEEHSPNTSSRSSLDSTHGNDEYVSSTEEHWNLDTGRSASDPYSSSSPIAAHLLRSPFTFSSPSPSSLEFRTTATDEGDWHAGYALDEPPPSTLPPQLLSVPPTKESLTLESYLRDIVTQQPPLCTGTDSLRNLSNKSNAEFVLQRPPKRTSNKSSGHESQLHGAMSLPPKPAVTMSPSPSPRPESRADLTKRADAGTPIITTQSLVGGKVNEPGSIRITASSKPAPSFFPVATAAAPSAGTVAFGQHSAPPYGGGALGLHGYGGVLNPTYSLNSAMIPGAGGYDGAYNALAAAPGAVAPSEFRTGDWVCISDSCSFHNFSRNTHCFGCGAAKPISCSVGPNKEPLRANAARDEGQHQQQQQQASYTSTLNMTQMAPSLIQQVSQMRMANSSPVPRHAVGWGASCQQAQPHSDPPGQVTDRWNPLPPPRMASSGNYNGNINANIHGMPGSSSPAQSSAPRSRATSNFSSIGRPVTPDSRSGPTHVTHEFLPNKGGGMYDAAGMIRGGASGNVRRSGWGAPSPNAILLAAANARLQAAQTQQQQSGSQQNQQMQHTLQQPYQPSQQMQPQQQAQQDLQQTQQQQQQQQQGQQISQQQQLPTPFVQTSPSTSLSTAAQLASLGVRIGPGVNPNAAATETNSGSAVSQPPIVNTGNLGPMCVQPGDWVCSKCAFVNWRRRRVCMRCFPFAEGNEVSASLASGALIAAQLAAGIDPSPETIASLAAPRRSSQSQQQPGSNERSRSDGSVQYNHSGVNGQNGTAMQDGAAPASRADGSRGSLSQHSALEEALQRLSMSSSNRSSLPATFGGSNSQLDGTNSTVNSAAEYASQHSMLRTRSSVGSLGQTSNTPPRFKMTASPLSPKPTQQGFSSAPRPSVPLPPPISFQQHQSSNSGPFGALIGQRRASDLSSGNPTPPLSNSHTSDQHDDHAFGQDLPSAPFVPDASWRARDVGPIGSIPSSMTSAMATMGNNGHAQQNNSFDKRFGGEINGCDGQRRNSDKQA